MLHEVAFFASSPMSPQTRPVGHTPLQIPPPLTFTALNPKTQTYAPVPSSLSRAKIPGGWLVYGTTSGGTALLVFVPDPDHQWDGASLP
jgi:hypothetical protein